MLRSDQAPWRGGRNLHLSANVLMRHHLHLSANQRREHELRYTKSLPTVSAAEASDKFRPPRRDDAAMKLPLQFLDPPPVLPGFHRTDRTGLAEACDRIPLPGIQLRHIQPLLAAPGTARRFIHCSGDDHRLQPCRCRPARLPALDPLPKASARQRSNVATLIPTSRDTKSIAELSGGNSLATIRSLYACPYRATFRYPRPQMFHPI